MTGRPVVVLTGGPGGGKSTLLAELGEDPQWAGRFVALPETVHYARFVGISPADRLFQRMVVNLQIALEEGLDRALGPDDGRPVICHRGSLDPLAFWLERGWPEEEFFAFTGTTLEDHYRRYRAVVHLVTAADGAHSAYRHWPAAHRPEEAEAAICLDGWLARAWGAHPAYFRLDNCRRSWAGKSQEARRLLAWVLAEESPWHPDGGR